MVSPQTKSRQEKRQNARRIVALGMEIYGLPKQDLQRIDSRNIKKVVADLKSMLKLVNPDSELLHF